MSSDYFLARAMRSLGSAADHAVEIHRVIARSPLMEDFRLSEVGAIGAYMPVFEATPGTVIISEGEIGDFMIVLISGLIDVTRNDAQGHPSRIAVVQEGHSLGEMSMLDGEARFASCTAIETSRFAVLSREALVEVIRVEPHLGAKILVKLVHILSQRLRNANMKLISPAQQERET